MSRMLIAYYSRSGNTKAMAESLAKGAGEVAGVEVDVKALGDVGVQDLKAYDAIVLGSPTYYGSMAADVKKLLDESVAIHGQLAGKVGGAFASSANIGGGNETTIMDILKALLIHGMVVPGSHIGDHYGPVSIGKVEKRADSECFRHGRMLADLTAKLHD